MKRGKVLKIATAMFTFVLSFVLAGAVFVQAVVAQNYFSQEQFLKSERSADYTSAFVNEEKDIKYRMYGDEFTLGDVNNILMPKDIMLVIDTSGSMAWEIGNGDNRVRLSVLKTAAKQFVDTFAGKNVRIAITTYSTQSNTPGTPITMMNSANVTNIKSQIDSLSANGSTNIGDAIRRAYYKLAASSGTDTAKYMVIMTDGEPNYFTSKSSISNYNQYKDITSYIKLTDGTASYKYGQTESHGLYYSRKAAELIKLNAQMKPYVVGISSGTTDSNLEAIGVAGGAAINSANGKHFYKALTGDDITNIYNAIAAEIDSELPFKSATINETLPLGVEPVSDLLPSGITAQILGDGRYKLTGSVSNIKLEKKVNGKYQVKETYVNIRVKFKTVGLKTFGTESGAVSYVDPFNNTKTASIQGQFSVLVGNPVTGVSDLADANIEKGTTLVVPASILPTDASNYSVEWWTESNLIARVDSKSSTIDGKLTANVYGVDVGTTKLHLKVTDNVRGTQFEKTCNINVGVKVASISSLTDLKIEKSAMKEASIDILPINASNVKYNWTVSDNTVATLDGKTEGTNYVYDGSGKIKVNVKGLKVGNTKLKLTVIDEFGNNTYSKECNVVVGISLDTVGQLSDTDIIRGNQKDFTLSVLPKDASNVSYTVSIGDSSILSLISSANGNYDGTGSLQTTVKGLKTGTTTLTVTITDAFSGKELVRQCNISVVVPVTGIEGANDIIIASGMQKIASALILPYDATNYSVEWTLTENDGQTAKIVETISENGTLGAKIEGVNSGTAKLKLYVKDNITGTEWTTYSLVTVGVPIDSISSASDIAVNKGRIKTVNITVNPEEASHVVFECSLVDQTIAKIVGQKYEDGVIQIQVQGIKYGTTKLNIKVTDEFKYNDVQIEKIFEKSCNVKVWNVDIQ